MGRGMINRLVACWSLLGTVLLLNGAAPAQGRRLLAAEGPATATASGKQRPVFMEYIGGGRAALSDVPIADFDASFDFYFILAFATNANPGDGILNGTWQPSLSPTNIAAIKSAHPTVKFSASIGGGGGNPDSIFQPTCVDAWIDNAVASLAVIISNYHLDAIDIDYESFGSSTADEFSFCIGELITQLKQKGLVKVATIAPYPGTDDFYMKLWESYHHIIDYVNYQFYSQGNIRVTQYVNLYKKAKRKYAGGVVIASFETINNGTSIVPAKGVEACKHLAEEGELHGIFIWSADQSYSNFQYEQTAQSLLRSFL